MIQAFDEYIPFDDPGPNEAHTLEITQLEAYVYVMWLLSLCKLLDHAERPAPVTCLWEIDDSGYRDHPMYPKDLVDYARSCRP